MRNEVKEFIEFISNLAAIKNDIKHNEFDYIYTLLQNAGYDFNDKELLQIRDLI